MSQQTPHATPNQPPMGWQSPLRVSLVRAKAHGAMLLREVASVAAGALDQIERHGELAPEDGELLDLVRAMVREANDMLALPASLDDIRPPVSVTAAESPVEEAQRREVYRRTAMTLAARE